MKLIIQRVKSATVSVETKTVGEIKSGLFVLVGIKKGDSKDNANYLAEKLAKMRVMSDENDKMNLSVQDAKASILVVSQFTLYANTTGGNRPSFIEVEEPSKAKELYLYFVEKLKDLGLTVEIGSFGEYMTIEAQLDGPVTIILEN